MAIQSIYHWISGSRVYQSIDQISFDGQFYQLEPTPSAPNIDWFTSYRGERNSKEAHGHFILACSDGGFLQIGESGSPVDSEES